MSKPKSPPAARAAVSNVLLVEVPPQFIALCEASGTRVMTQQFLRRSGH